MDGYIEYYYGFSNVSAINDNGYYYFVHNNEWYYFCPLTRLKIELDEIVALIKWDNLVDSIVYNVNNDYISHVYNFDYILIKHNTNIDIDGYRYLLTPQINISGSYVIDKSNWIELWSKKIDNIEYLVDQKNRKCTNINNSINYYIGMAETAVTYMRRVLDNNMQLKKKTISHIRMSDKDICNPQNIIIDYEGRDVSEYFKYVFFNKHDKCLKVTENVLKYNKYDYFSLCTIYARLFFPTFYFDGLDKTDNEDLVDDYFNFIVRYVDEYEQYINYVYSLICRQKKIPKVLWI